MSLRQYIGQQNEQQMFGVACVGDDFWCSSACLELDQTAQIISYEEYHPFGTTSYRSGRTETEVSLKRYKYVGKERDEETGLYYYGARYYAAWICRFVSVDPLQFEYPQLTPYNYAGNKPVTHIDIDGMQGTGDEPIQSNNGSKLNENPYWEESVVTSAKEITNFYVKIGDSDAREDIQNLIEKIRNQRYLNISDKGEVTLEFGNLSKWRIKQKLKRDKGLKLINDLVNAIDNDGKVVKTLYQTTGPFNFTGYKEGIAMGGYPDKVPNNWDSYTDGEISEGKNFKQFNYIASYTAYGVNSRGEKTSTLLPARGFQSQVAIAPGSIESVITKWVTDRTEVYDPVSKKTEIKTTRTSVDTFSNNRSVLVMHELRESLFRSVSFLSYSEAHNATIKMYGNWEIVRFIWKK